MLKDFKGAILYVTHDRKLLEEVDLETYELTNKGLKRLNTM